ncbi:NUDIX hydrolase [Candidatus Pacearchaeota archaeon]|nr:NUDIX hydrolase [Candidatus Pacearchaeota archaeon]
MQYEKPSVTADIIILKKKELLLVERRNHPYQGYFALPGGFLNVNCETVKEAAQRELREETSLEVKLDDLILVGESSNPNRDPRGHIVSLHYFAKNYSGELKAGDDAKRAEYFHLNNLPELAFDHLEIIDNFKEWMKKYGGELW